MTKKSAKETKEESEKNEVIDTLIISPRVTEKAADLSSQNVYTFNVKENATKINLAKEIEKTYKVKPLKINILNQPRTATFTRGKLGFRSGFKKATVFLKKGDKINLA